MSKQKHSLKGSQHNSASKKRILAMPSDTEIDHLFNLYSQGKLADAETSARAFINQYPNHPTGWMVLGVVLKQEGRTEEALAPMQKTVQLSPNDPGALSNLGVTLSNLGRHGEAYQHLNKACKLLPDHPQILSNLGITLKALGRFEEAEACHRKALRLQPNLAEAHCNLGNTLQAKGKLKAAEESFQRAIAIRPNYAEAYNNLGNVFQETDQLAQAEAAFSQALKIRPDYAEALYNMGNLYNLLRRFSEAETFFCRALELNPGYADAYNNLGNTLKELWRLEEAEACYQKALKINPDLALTISNLLFTMNYSCQYNQSQLFGTACRFGNIVSKEAAGHHSSWQFEKQPTRLKVGIVSGDLCNHPVSFFLEGMLSHIDKSRIELVAYSSNKRHDDITDRIKPLFDDWKSIAGLDDKDAAEAIQGQGIHLLLDLSGHTTHNRLSVFAYKPAPVLVTWLGYSGTTGLAQMDYILGDPHVTPHCEAAHFTESIWQLPESYICYTPPNESVEPIELPALFSKKITFGCFNNLAKINDHVMALWSKILDSVPNSVLLLRTKQLADDRVKENTARRFAQYGIESDRLILDGSFTHRIELFAAYNRVDIALDPFPYNGTTTSVEALWMGVPVLTMRGDRFISHVGESILTNADLPEWIAADEDDYVAKAVEFTSDLDSLSRLRAGLREQVLSSPLFDAPRFARHFEDAIWGMWNKYLQDKGKLD